MDRLMCTRCGETLHYDGELLKCDYCGATYEKEKAKESIAKLEEALGNAKMELVANRKRHLWDVTHEKYPSKEKVVEAANAVISISAEDFLARIYLHSHDRDPLKLNSILASSNVDVSQAAEAFRWLLPSLSSRTVGPLHDFVDRHFADKDRFEKATAIETEAAKISQGIYEPGLPRDVFLCYSSHDMPTVVALLDLLEQNGFACFAAFRNLRHGKGAQEDYLSAIKVAMRSCEVLVFVSSNASRSMECDALRVELSYLIQELPDKPRVEYVIEDYGETPFMVKRTLKKAFPSQEYCRDEEDLMVRIQNAIEGLAFGENVSKEQKEAGHASKFDEEELRRQAEEEAKQELLREKMKKEARERILAEEEENRRQEEERKALQKKKEQEARAKAEEEKKRRKEEEAKALEKKNEQETRAAAEEEKRKAAPKVKADGFLIEGNYIYYGRYPQARASDAATINALKGLKPGSNGYIQYGGEEYAEAKGEYFLVQPIKWRILERKDGEALVVSDMLLDAHLYADSSNNYKESEVRAWLNGEFLSSAFPNGDKRILAKEVDNSPATTDSSSNPYACKNTQDKVFLLSYGDYRNGSFGFADNASRQCSPTDYAVAKGAYKDSNGYGWHWTRSPGSDYSYRAWYVYQTGGFSDRGVYYGDSGVRPAIWVSIPAEEVGARQDPLKEKFEKDSRESILAGEEKKKSTPKAMANAFRIEGDYVYYGRYPQTKATDAATINALKGLKPGSNGYIQHNGEEYAEAKGDYFLVQPIKWRILERKGNEALVVSDMLLDQHRYDGKSNNYKDSEIREWLYGEFLSSAFSNGDKRILAKEVDNSIGSTDAKKTLFGGFKNKFVCENTRDKVFLLSYRDYQNASYGFSNDASRQCKPTAYAVAKGAYNHGSNGHGYYWTRSPYSGHSNYAWIVTSDGCLRDFGGVNDVVCGVRPGLWISIAE